MAQRGREFRRVLCEQMVKRKRGTFASVAGRCKDMVEANDDLRELLLMATLRYKNDEEMPSGDESAASPVSPASSREDREQH